MSREIVNNIKAALPGIALAFFASFLMLVYAPLELYLTNSGEFWFTAGQILPTALLMFAAVFVLLSAVLIAARCISRRLYSVLFAVGLIAALSCYIHGTFLVSGLPGIDGANIDWGAYPAERIKSLLVWAVIAAAVIIINVKLGAEKTQKFSAFGSLALTLILLMTLVTLGLTSSSDKDIALTSTDRDMFLMSENQNFIILVMDAVDGEQFDAVLSRDTQYSEIFSDFTFYDNAMSCYPFSKCSAAQILTGEWYLGEGEFADYVRSAFAESRLMNELNSRGYVTDIYTTEAGILEGLSREQFPNLTDDQPAIKSQLLLGKFILKMAAVKHAPWDLKAFGYDILGRLPECRTVDPRYGYDYFDWADDVFYSRIKDANPVTLTQENRFKFMHLEGAHVPYHYNKNVEVAEDADYWSSIEASIRICGTLLDRYKEAGVYDNSVILIMADHGYAKIEDPRLNTEQQHPFLLIKGLDEHHEMQRSSAPVSYDDLQGAYLKLMDGAGSDSVFAWKEGDSRERRFAIYDWMAADRFEEYVQTGRAEDMNTFQPTGRVFTK